ncbi:hypothetical protein SSCG_01339 [Streptomyces clavuligerus]|nr:hypothetical protein SSCG_01339 [Streptomyces clavuligerus]
MDGVTGGTARAGRRDADGDQQQRQEGDRGGSVSTATTAVAAAGECGVLARAIAPTVGPSAMAAFSVSVFFFFF